jgi:hypothetical protein
MRIDDASRLPTGHEQANTTLVLPAIAADELSVVQIEPEDASLDAVVAALNHHRQPVIILLPQQSWVFSQEQDFARLKEVSVDIVSFVIPRERIAVIGKFAYAQGFHFTSQLSKAEAAFLHRQNQYSGQVQLTSDEHSPIWNNTLQQHDDLVDASKQQQTPLPVSSLQNTGEYEQFQQEVWKTGYDDPVTPLPETHLPGVSTPPVRKRPARRRQLLAILIVVSLLIIVSAVLLPSLLAQPAAPLTVPTHHTTAAIPSGSVGQISFVSSGQLDPNSATGLNDIVSLNLTGLTPPPQGMSYYAWLETDKTQDGTAPILLGKLQVSGGKVQLSYQDKQHVDLLVTYSRLLITQQSAASTPNIPPLDSKTWRYQAGIPDTPTPGDEKGYSLLSHMRHLLAKDPTLNQIGLQGGLDIWMYRNVGKIFEWSNAARDDWAGNNIDLTRRQIDRVVEYLNGQVYAFRNLPAGTPWLVDPKAGRPGLIDFTTAQDEQGPPSYISHIKLHLMGMVNAPGHTAAQQQLAGHIDDSLTQIGTLLKKVLSDAIQLAKMSNDQFKHPNALALLNDMQINANNAYVGQTDPTTGAVQAGEVWVHAQMQSFASMQVTTATADGP